LIGGTLAEEVNHFEARLIAQALEQENGSITRAARELGLTHQGPADIIDGRHRTLAVIRRQKEIAANRFSANQLNMFGARAARPQRPYSERSKAAGEPPALRHSK
jgi:transcriptional regulator with GAF, ATPase, and Fis domain